MAHYKPPHNIPSVESLRTEHEDQSESEKFVAQSKQLIVQSGIDEHAFILNCIAHLYEQGGVSELTKFMSFVKSSLGIIDDTRTQSKAYEFVKGIPALSDSRIGYTFGRKRGLFLFLKNHGGSNGTD